MNDLPPLCARLAIATVGLRPIIPELRISGDVPLRAGVDMPRAGVPGWLMDPTNAEGTGNSPRSILSKTA